MSKKNMHHLNLKTEALEVERTAKPRQRTGRLKAARRSKMMPRLQTSASRVAGPIGSVNRL